LSIIKSGKVPGAPDMVIEIMYPGNENFDKVQKRKVYETCGVKEYFIIHQRSKEVIALYLKNGRYVPGRKTKSKIESKLLKKSFEF
jgi:Uma2 family endonuclease